MKKYLALALAILMVLALCACGEKAETPSAESAVEGPADVAPDAEGPTWAEYQEYLIEKAGANAPDLDEFKNQV